MDFFLPDGSPAFSHTADRPFATLCRIEKTYVADRGTAKVTQNEVLRLPLTDVAQDGDTTVFSSGEHALSMTAKPLGKGMLYSFSGEPGFAYSFRLDAFPDEAVFGGGEQYRKVNLRGERVSNFVSEHIKASTIIEKTLLVGPLYREKDHSQIGSYSPIPAFVTSRHRMIFFQTNSDGYSDFGDESYVFQFDRCPASLFLASGSSYEELVRQHLLFYPNRQHLPDWCLNGMILGIQGGTDTILAKAHAMQKAGVEVCGIWAQDWSGSIRTIMGKQVWWNWEADPALYHNIDTMIRELGGMGIRFLAYINPYLVKDSKLYNHCRELGYLITKKDGSVYHIRSTTFDAGMLDLTNPEAVRFIKDVLIRKNMIDIGISGWMADFGEYLPVDCVLYDGDPALLHNQWPVLWAKVNREAIEESGRDDLMFFTRAGYAGIQNYAPIMWNGDQHTDLTKDYGMPTVMPASFSLGFSGVPLVHCDIGGFFSFDRMHRNAELFTRWMEMCTFSPLMRSHESLRPWANSQFDSKKVLPHTVRLTSVHRTLKPYLKHVLEEASQGIPAIRPDFWFGSFDSHRDEYAYYFGDDLFVAPVIKRGAVRRSVCLPAGDWIHLWSGQPFSGDVAVSAPLGYPPVFYRKESRFTSLFEEIRNQYE